MIAQKHSRLPGPESSAGLSLASMTDLVFLLLIFFMLTSPMVLTSALPEITPPETRAPRRVEKAADQIGIDAANAITLNGAKLAASDLDAKLRDVRTRAPRIAVLADDRSDLGVVVRVMDACRAAGLQIDVYATPARPVEPSTGRSGGPAAESSPETAKIHD